MSAGLHTYNMTFSHPEKWNGASFLMSIPEMSVIQRLKTTLDGDELLMFTSMEFAARAQEIYDSLKITNLTMENVWDVFKAMYHIMYPDE